MVDLTDPEVRNRNARARAFAVRAAQAKTSADANAPSLGQDIVGGTAAVARGMLRGATGVLDLPAAAVTGIGNIPATFYNASQPYGPRKPTPTPQEFFGKPGEPAMQPTDLFDKVVPLVKGYEHTALDLPAQVAGGMLVGGGYRGIAGAPAAGARAGVIPSLAVAPAATPGFLPALGRGAKALTGALARAGIRTGVATGAMVGGQKAGGYLGRTAAEALGGPQYGDLGQHYGEQAGMLGGPIALDAARMAGYNVLNDAYTKPGDVTVPGSSAHTLQALDNLGLPVDLGTAGNAQASNLLDFTASLPGAGRPAMEARAGLYRGLEQGVTDAAANRRLLATGGVGPPAPGVGRNIDEVSIGGRAVDAAVAARNAINDAQDVVYNDPRVGLHQLDPVTGQPILARGDPIAVQTEHQAYNDIMANPETAQARAAPQINRLTGELRQSSNLVVDPALETQLQADWAALSQQRAALMASGAPDPAVLAQIDAARTQVGQAIGANRGPSFQAQRDLRALGRTRDGVIVLDNRINDASAAAKTETMRQAAENRGLGGVFDTAETEAGRLLGQRDALSGLLPNDANVRPTGQEGFNALFSKGGAGDLEQLGALLEHAPADTGLTFADRLELAGRGKATAGTRDMNPTAYKPEAIVQLWDNASPAARDAYAPQGTPLRTHLEAVVTVARADALRTAARTKPGRGSNTLGGPQRFFANPLTLAGIGTGVGSLFGVPGLGAALGLLPSAVARLVGNRFTNPDFVRNVIHPPSLGESLDLSRILGAAVGGNSGSDQSAASPGAQSLSAAEQKALDLARSPLKTLRVPGFQ